MRHNSTSITYKVRNTSYIHTCAEPEDRKTQTSRCTTHPTARRNKRIRINIPAVTGSASLCYQTKPPPFQKENGLHYFLGVLGEAKKRREGIIWRLKSTGQRRGRDFTATSGRANKINTCFVFFSPIGLRLPILCVKRASIGQRWNMAEYCDTSSTNRLCQSGRPKNLCSHVIKSRDTVISALPKISIYSFAISQITWQPTHQQTSITVRINV